jgi:hypothetical protein
VCLNLNEHQRAPVESDQVDLATTRTIVARERLEAPSPKMLDRELLAIPAESATIIPAGPAVSIARATNA